MCQLLTLALGAYLVAVGFSDGNIFEVTFGFLLLFTSMGLFIQFTSDGVTDREEPVRPGHLVVTRQGLCEVQGTSRTEYVVAKIFTWNEVERIAVSDEYIIVIGRSNFAINDNGDRVDTTPRLRLRFQDKHGSADEVAEKIRSTKELVSRRY